MATQHQLSKIFFFRHFYPRLGIRSEKPSVWLSLWGVIFSEHHAILRLLALYWGGFMCSTSGSIAGRHEDKFMSDHTGRREPSGELPSLLQTHLECLKPLKNTERKKCVKGQIDQVRRRWSHCADFKTCECSDVHGRPTFTPNNDASSYQTPMSLDVDALGSGFHLHFLTNGGNMLTAVVTGSYFTILNFA